MQQILKILILASLLLATGCAAILNPYEEDFLCNRAGSGKCVSVQEAYDESTGKVTITKSDEEDGKIIITQNSDAEGIYREALYKRLSNLLTAPKTPLISPPKVMRILLLPYRGDENDLYMSRYIFFLADDSKWVLGDYLMGDNK